MGRLFASVVLVEERRGRFKVVGIKRRKKLIQNIAHGVPHLPAEPHRLLSGDPVAATGKGHSLSIIGALKAVRHLNFETQRSVR
ncbi:hypothetical protein GCM10009712_03670 [Pseudarthrobacter sulfonivorans]